MIVRGYSESENNKFVSVQGLTFQNDQILRVESGGSRALPKLENTEKAVCYELSLSQIVLLSDHYSALDWLRDIGGLAVAIKLICSSLVFLLQF